MGLTKAALVASMSLQLASCAATFPYRYYNFDVENHKLLGDTPEHDLLEATCVGKDGDKFPCTIMMTDEAYNLKADYLKTKQDLIDCQKGNPPTPKLGELAEIPLP